MSQHVSLLELSTHAVPLVKCQTSDSFEVSVYESPGYISVCSAMLGKLVNSNSYIVIDLTQLAGPSRPGALPPPPN